MKVYMYVHMHDNQTVILLGYTAIGYAKVRFVGCEQV